VTGSGGKPVAVVTGGGAGIGAAVAEELGRTGWSVVTMDPLVSLDGSERLPEPEETTAGRIIAAGGTARASSVSVTDADAVRDEIERIVKEDGRLDAVINVAGISRPSGFASGAEDDWRNVLSVHLDGYRNVLDAALPVMAEVGRGRILGVTSGSGWRPADAGAYSCAKRAVASLTWQVGAVAPPGVSVNAMSPIAVTRMVTAALSRAAAGGRTSASGGLSLGSMPEPEKLGPLAAYLVSEKFGWCRGQVIFAGGVEAALVERPRLLEVVRTDPESALAQILEVVGPGAFVTAEGAQASGGGTNPRFQHAFDEPPPLSPSAVRSCAIVTDRPELGAAIESALKARVSACHQVRADGVGFEAAAAALARIGAVDAVIVALAGAVSASSGSEWERVLAEHDGIASQIFADASWVRAVADASAASGESMRLVIVTDATTAGGRSRAQAIAQLARAGRGATENRVAAFTIGVESPSALTAAAELAAHLVSNNDASGLAGADLVAGDGWLGLRSHPRPIGSIVLGGPQIPEWFDGLMREIVGQ
jgi:NAD(P)-dependent dehydrogenase (short-subunit alcohol dehydrogenase family)